jgi:hypothetical protein
MDRCPQLKKSPLVVIGCPVVPSLTGKQSISLTWQRQKFKLSSPKATKPHNASANERRYRHRCFERVSL